MKKYICLDVINGTMGTIVIIKSTEFTIMVFYHKRKNVRHKSHNLFRGSFKKIEMIEIEILSNDNFPLWPEKPAFVGTTHLEIINNLYIECFSRKNEKKNRFFLYEQCHSRPTEWDVFSRVINFEKITVSLEL